MTLMIVIDSHACHDTHGCGDSHVTLSLPKQEALQGLIIAGRSYPQERMITLIPIKIRQYCRRFQKCGFS